MNTKTSEEREVEELREAIRRLTKRIVVSDNVKYLRRRLEDLKANKKAGKDVRVIADASNSATVLTTVSMHEDARDALLTMANRLQVGKSATVRAGLRALALEQGWRDLAARFEGTEVE